MPITEAGKVRSLLDKASPNGTEKFDFWSMKNAGVVSGDQVERVARFFAAGIVCENPKQFGLNDQTLSEIGK
jgi:hypothetical protein